MIVCITLHRITSTPSQRKRSHCRTRFDKPMKTVQNCTNYAKGIITLTQQDDRQMNGNPVFVAGILEKLQMIFVMRISKLN